MTAQDWLAAYAHSIQTRAWPTGTRPIDAIEELVRLYKATDRSAKCQGSISLVPCFCDATWRNHYGVRYCDHHKSDVSFWLGPRRGWKPIRNV